MTQDDMIKQKVEEALSENMHNSSLGVNVQVEKGYVTLTGIVDVLSEKDYAERVVNSISGIKGVNNALTVGMDGEITDEQITQQVIGKFISEPQLEAQEVGATTKRGAVYLQGRVKTLAEANIARELASTVMGVKDVVMNQLKIGDNLEGPHDDATITNAVEVALSASEEVSARDVRTSCRNGVIYLDGTVNTLKEKETAGRLASTVPGVRQVVNNLSTRHGGNDRDSELTNLLRERLRKNEWATPGFQIEAYVIDGTAYLDGEVYSVEAKSQAELVAGGIPGIKQVQNDIEVARH